MKLATKIATTAAVTTTLVVATALPAQAATTYLNGHVTSRSTCSTAFSYDCNVYTYTPNFGYNAAVKVHEDAPVYNCTSIGIKHGVRLGSSGTIGQLRADRHKIIPVSGSPFWVGAKVTIQYNGPSSEDYIRCNY